MTEDLIFQTTAAVVFVIFAFFFIKTMFER